MAQLHSSRERPEGCERRGNDRKELEQRIIETRLKAEHVNHLATADIHTRQILCAEIANHAVVWERGMEETPGLLVVAM